MKILHLITRMDGGGSAVNTLLSGIEQCRAGHQVTLAYGPSFESDMSSQEQARVDTDTAVFKALGGHIAILPSMLRSMGKHDWQAYREIKILLQQGFDIVHTHTSKAGALGRLAARGLEVGVVHTPHGHIFHGYFGMLKTKIFIAIERLLAYRTKALIALTRAERDDHLKLSIGRSEQWHVIPSGVDVQRIERHICQLQRQTNALKWDAVSVGRLVPIKGMERLIKAWAIVCQHKPNARLALLGDGEERQGLQSLACALGIEEQVYFAGWQDPLPFLASARCFALLSHNEGMGRAVVEAFAAGLPCIVSDVCGLRELVDEDVGCVVNAEESEQVAEALLQAWHPSIQEATRIRSRAYSVEAMMDGLERVYQHVRA
ncbi:MAG: glycosyltransferase [Mariprofundaceae bacterium]|nr:glycosyltransferase [Mariprofundaceae bacterium]